MSLNFPFIFLALLRLAPQQALLVSAISVAAQCWLGVKKAFTPIQICFNIAGTVFSTGVATLTFLYARQHGAAVVLAMSLASLCYFFCSTGSVALVIASAMNQRAFPLWKREFPWYLPFYLVGAALAVTTAMISDRFGWQMALLMLPAVYVLYRFYNGQVLRLREHAQHLSEVEALHLRTIEGLSMAIEAKDQNTHEHLFRVRDHVERMGRLLNLSSLEMQALQTASFLHDIGKLAVPETIINKPGKLTPEEFEKIKIHPGVGAEILERVRFPYPVVPIVRSHHEWWNGDGYPDGLSGEEIPLGARILSIADCFDALVSDRPYRNGLPVQHALAVIKKMSGVQFDPALVSLFLGLHEHSADSRDRSDSSTFNALKTDLDVVRGTAPGAGFQGSTVHEAETSRSEMQREQRDPALLSRIAVACEGVQHVCEASAAGRGVLTAGQVLSLWASQVRSVLAFDTVAVYLNAQAGLRLYLADGYDDESFHTEPAMETGGVSGWVAQTGKPILNGNVAEESFYRSILPPEERLNSALSVPLLDAAGEGVGVLTLYSKASDVFVMSDLTSLTAVSRKTSRMIKELVACPTGSRTAKASPNVRPWPAVFHSMNDEVAKARSSGGRLKMFVWSRNPQLTSDDPAANEESREAQALRSFVEFARPLGISGLLGDREVVLLTPSTALMPADDGLSTLEMPVELLELHGYSNSWGVPGVAYFPEDGLTVEEVLAAAELRLYKKQLITSEPLLIDLANSFAN